MEGIEQKSKKERKRMKRGVVVEGLSSAKKKMRERKGLVKG
jgi:hypothetical protein